MSPVITIALLRKINDFEFCSLVASFVGLAYFIYVARKELRKRSDEALRTQWFSLRCLKVISISSTYFDTALTRCTDPFPPRSLDLRRERHPQRHLSLSHSRNRRPRFNLGDRMGSLQYYSMGNRHGPRQCARGDGECVRWASIRFVSFSSDQRSTFENSFVVVY